ncbi:MAG: hypothetical protein K5695_08105 [Oscillospiraceae bacterium]|nr:hypothetical protein [Oscillospiraceae bacterium]
MKKHYLALIAAAALLLTGCGRKTYADFTPPQQGESSLQPVDSIYRESHFEGIAPTQEPTLRTVRSADGICVIDCKESYYDVTLDYTQGSYYAAGAAYAEAIRLVREDYAAYCEGYLYENIKAAFPNLNNDYSGIQKRVETIYNTLDRKYQEEIDGFADKMDEGAEGFAEDGILSHDEVVLMQLVPDVLRGTSCSALTASGEATATGERITCRVLEWQLGSENQMCSGHSVLHVQNGDKSYVSVSMLGFLTILTAVNDDGLLLGELDVGSFHDVPYKLDGKTSYTYALRYALEEFSTAKEAADHLTKNAARYPYCVNVLCTDAQDAYIAELAVNEKDGEPVIRDGGSALNDGLVWDDPAYLCAVNSFAAKGNADGLVHNVDNIVRWNRYADLFCGQQDLTLDRFKELMTSEKTDNTLTRIRSAGLVHMLIADYSTHRMQAILTGTEGVTDEQVFVDLGSWD